MWKDITANMMSDEEDSGGNAFKVRAPEWRLEELNKLLKDLAHDAVDYLEQLVKSVHQLV